MSVDSWREECSHSHTDRPKIKSIDIGINKLSHLSIVPLQVPFSHHFDYRTVETNSISGVHSQTVKLIVLWHLPHEQLSVRVHVRVAPEFQGDHLALERFDRRIPASADIDGRHLHVDVTPVGLHSYGNLVAAPNETENSNRFLSHLAVCRQSIGIECRYVC